MEAKYKVGDTVYCVRDAYGWYHGIADGRKAVVKIVTPLHPIKTFEYEVMDENGDFWHIPEDDLSNVPLTKKHA